MLCCGFTLLALAFFSSSCSVGDRRAAEEEYAKAFKVMEKSATKKGFPRQKIFHQFQLDGLSSMRVGLSGVRGGLTWAWEEWQLPLGYKLRASMSTYVGVFKVVPFQGGLESIFVEGRRFMLKEEFYKEARLEPYFESIRLLNHRDEQVRLLYIPRKRKSKEGD